MPRQAQRMVSSLAVVLLLVISTWELASAERAPGHDPAGESCPFEAVKTVPGSKIVFLEDSVDFGQIPLNRKVTHIFRFRNAGTEPLLLARHVKSKPIEGC
jgi:hypothetical protein